MPLFSGSGAVYPFEDEPNAAVVAVVAALVPGCVGVGSVTHARFGYRLGYRLVSL